MTEWPVVTYEMRPWAGAEEAPSRTARRRHRGPYEAAVVPAIAGVSRLPIPVDVLARAEEAAAEIARFDADVGHEVAPFSALLLRSESAASSRIEDLTASAKAVALAELGDPRGHNANVIVANTRAMQAAIDLADRLDAEAVVAMQETLLGASSPRLVGGWRDEQVWIGGSSFGPHGATFVPPHHERVPAAMDDLVTFMARDDLPVLVQAAVAHAQFETIHPFPDGNGRTGRSLVHALLRGKGLTRLVTVPVSAGLLTDTASYFAALTAYREGHPAAIVERLAEASFLAIANGRELVADLRGVRSAWDERITARRGAAAWGIADLLLRQPVIDSPLAQRELDVTAANVNRAVEHLVEAGVLRQVGDGRRYRRWAAPEVLGALDAFAGRADRRPRH